MSRQLFAGAFDLTWGPNHCELLDKDNRVVARFLPAPTPGHVRLIGDPVPVISFRGERYLLTGGRPPHKAGSTGLVYVTPVPEEVEEHPDTDDQTIDDIVASQGWTDSTVLDLLWEYVHSQGDPAAVRDHFLQAAEEA